MRRYGAANRLNRLATLTYAGAGCHDPVRLRADLAEFFRALRTAGGGHSFPYMWVPEWHKTDHGLHAHFAVGDYIARGVIEQAWGRGFVNIKLIGHLGVGSGRLEEARKAAGYLSKYVGKAFDAAKVRGLHRFDVAQGFQPERVRIYGRSADDALDRATAWMGGEFPDRYWRSSDQPEWNGPPAVWAAWPG